MTVFVDTSGLYALLNRDDADHAPVAGAFEALLADDELLLAHSYVLVETTALTQRRLGLDAVRALRDELFPVLTVEWVDASLHAEAFAALVAAGKRSVSLVDHVSFELMRRRNVARALATDRHFEAQGFELVAFPAAGTPIDDEAVRALRDADQR